MSLRPMADSRATSSRLPTYVVLGAIVAAATVISSLAALRSPSPWIVPDELIYSELAKSLGDGGLPSVRGEVSLAWGLGYPALLAPVWAVFDDVTRAYAVAKVANALVMSLTALPAYFLARRFVASSPALLVAGLCVSVPSMLYAGTLMTEVALYPAFVLALLAIAAALERQCVPAQIAALGAIALACAVKSISVVLFVAYALAIVLHDQLERRSAVGRTIALRRFRATWAALGALTLAVLLIPILGGRSPYALLGTYSSVLSHMRPADVPIWILAHVAELDLSVAVIPFAATLVVVWRTALHADSPEERLFAALAVPVAGCWLVAVGAFASVPFLDVFGYPENVSRLQGRSTFMLAPLLFVGLALWLRDRTSGSIPVAAAAFVAVFLPAFIRLDDLDGNVRFQALSLVPWVGLGRAAIWPVGGLAFAGVLTTVFVLSARKPLSAGVVVAPVFVGLVTVSVWAHSSMRSASDWTRSAAWGTSPDWIDEAVGESSSVSVLWAEPPGRPFVDLERRHRIVFVGEFFNRSVGRVFELGSSLPYALPATSVRLVDGRVQLENGQPAALGDLVLTPCYIHVRGATVAHDPLTGASVIRVHGTVQARIDPPDSCAGS